MHTHFTTTHAAAHVAQYLHEQAVTPRPLTIDERIDKCIVDMKAAIANDDKAQIAALKIEWREIWAEANRLGLA